MGNCLVQESSMHWGGDDWGSPAPDDEADHHPFFSTKRRRCNHCAAALVQDHHEDTNTEEKGSFGNFTPTTSTSSRTAETAAREVKIKVTRGQLETFLGKVDLKELSVQQVLEQLMIISTGGKYEVHDQESWRPALHSIPE